MSPKPMPLPNNMASDDRPRSTAGPSKTFTRPGWYSAADRTRPESMPGNVETDAGTACNGIAIYQPDKGTLLYVANFGDGTVDVFDCNRRQVSSFTDPGLPGSYAPLDLQLVDGSVFVTFVHRDAVHCDQVGQPEHGFIAEFNPDGILLDRAEFRLGRRYDAVWHRQMRERIANRTSRGG